MIITFANYKGGTGKTTLSQLFALMFDHMHKTVAILDRDPQKTLTEVMNGLKRDGLSGVDVIDDLASHINDYEFIIIDTQPELNADLIRSVKDANRLVMVTGDGLKDLISTKKALDYIGDALLPNVRPRLLFNRIKKNTRLSREIDATSENLGLERCQFVVHDSVNFKDIDIQGLKALSEPQLSALRDVMFEVLAD